jgi:hypothetical protein
VLTVKKKQSILTDIVITRVVLCSQTDYHFDYKLQDSVRAFINRYTTDSSYVDVKDSIYKHYEPVWVRGNMRRYTDDGYDCECPR